MAEPVTAPAPLRLMAVVGGGTMGVGIAYVYKVAGCDVWLVEPDATRQVAVRDILRRAASSGVARGKLTAEVAAAVQDEIRIVPAAGGLPAGLDLIVETVPENPALKETVLRELGALDPRILATNTSSISIDRCCRSSMT